MGQILDLPFWEGFFLHVNFGKTSAAMVRGVEGVAVSMDVSAMLGGVEHVADATQEPTGQVMGE